MYAVRWKSHHNKQLNLKNIDKMPIRFFSWIFYIFLKASLNLWRFKVQQGKDTGKLIWQKTSLRKVSKKLDHPRNVYENYKKKLLVKNETIPLRRLDVSLWVFLYPFFDFFFQFSASLSSLFKIFGSIYIE